MEKSKDLEKALDVLRSGGIILYPTDTIWGLGCDATNEKAVERLFKIKKRPDSKAMISLVESMESLSKWVEPIPEGALKELRKDGQRPLTIIYDSPAGISSLLKAEDGSAGFRITNHEFSNNLCKKLGRPLVSTSANFSGKASPSCFDEIDEEIKKGVDYACQTGRDTFCSVPSRIVKVSEDGIIIIRE